MNRSQCSTDLQQGRDETIVSRSDRLGSIAGLLQEELILADLSQGRMRTADCTVALKVSSQGSVCASAG
ncbi:hypothetical protein FKM82_002158 [Ascaphus truei]